MTNTSTSVNVKLKVGQVWKSRDPREKRSVKIRGFEGDKVVVQRVTPSDSGYAPATTKVSRDRFNTTSSRGYELETDVA